MDSIITCFLEVCGARIPVEIPKFKKVANADYRYHFKLKGQHPLLSYEIESKYPNGLLVRVHIQQGLAVMTILDDDDNVVNRTILKKGVMDRFVATLT